MALQLSRPVQDYPDITRWRWNGGRGAIAATVDSTDRTIRRQLDVRRLQVAMNDAAIVGGVERQCNLPGNGNRFTPRDRAKRDPLSERRTVHEVQDQRPGVSRFLDPIDRGDVRVIQRREEVGFACEASQTLVVECEQLR
jgi:hypothetical protein